MKSISDVFPEIYAAEIAKIENDPRYRAKAFSQAARDPKLIQVLVERLSNAHTDADQLKIVEVFRIMGHTALVQADVRIALRDVLGNPQFATEAVQLMALQTVAEGGGSVVRSEGMTEKLIAVGRTELSLQMRVWVIVALSYRLDAYPVWRFLTEIGKQDPADEVRQEIQVVLEEQAFYDRLYHKMDDGGWHPLPLLSLQAFDGITLEADEADEVKLKKALISSGDIKLDSYDNGRFAYGLAHEGDAIILFYRTTASAESGKVSRVMALTPDPDDESKETTVFEDEFLLHPLGEDSFGFEMPLPVGKMKGSFNISSRLLFTEPASAHPLPRISLAEFIQDLSDPIRLEAGSVVTSASSSYAGASQDFEYVIGPILRQGIEFALIKQHGMLSIMLSTRTATVAAHPIKISTVFRSDTGETYNWNTTLSLEHTGEDLWEYEQPLYVAQDNIELEDMSIELLPTS